MDHVVVVGASLAGVHAAQALRRADPELRITVVGDEPHLPYDRPPLSKAFLGGDTDVDSLTLRPVADPEALGIHWELGASAVSLDPEERVIGVERSSAPGRVDSVAYDGLVIATGATPRSLPGCDLVGVHLLRTLDDALALREALTDRSAPLVVIGAGFIGAEVAATARQRGADVVLVEAAPLPLQRVLDEVNGAMLVELHRDHGVDVHVGAVATIIGEFGRVVGVELDDGTRIDTDRVVVGIGVSPSTDWLDGSGIVLDDGVVCDETMLASPGVVAAGDVARWPNPRYPDRTLRVEQWDNAIAQGAHAAATLLAHAVGEQGEPFDPVPWFWSDQFDAKIQMAGVVGVDAEILQRSPDERRLVQLHLDEAGQPCGVVAWNRPRQAIQGRQLLARGASVDDVRSTLS